MKALRQSHQLAPHGDRALDSIRKPRRYAVRADDWSMNQWQLDTGSGFPFVATESEIPVAAHDLTLLTRDTYFNERSPSTTTQRPSVASTILHEIGHQFGPHLGGSPTQLSPWVDMDVSKPSHSGPFDDVMTYSPQKETEFSVDSIEEIRKDALGG